MPGVTRGETVDTDNPLLFFAYQTNGLLTDIYELTQEVLKSDGSVQVAEAPLDLADAPTGVKLGTGRYAANFATTGSWDIGTHTIVWRYRITDASSPQRTHRQDFEVLDPLRFAAGSLYVGYARSCDLLAKTPFSTLEVAQIQELIDSSSRYIELLTARFFEPRYLQVPISGLDGPILFLSHPLIGLDQVFELGIGPADQLAEIDRTALRVFNRHLDGLLDPDDRDHPHLEFATDLLPGRVIAQGSFAPGSKNVEVRAVFGYTDFDGGPMGRAPKILQRAIGILSSREAQDPFAADPFTSASGRIKSARTRDQAVSFDTGGGGSVQAGAITGDRAVDDYLLNLMRPPYMAAI